MEQVLGFAVVLIVLWWASWVMSKLRDLRHDCDRNWENTRRAWDWIHEQNDKRR